MVKLTRLVSVSAVQLCVLILRVANRRLFVLAIKCIRSLFETEQYDKGQVYIDSARLVFCRTWCHGHRLIIGVLVIEVSSRSHTS